MNLGNIIRNAMGRTTSGTTRAGGTVRRPSVPNATGRARTTGRAGGGIADRILGMLKRR
jgi:hypothetical protein